MTSVYLQKTVYSSPPDLILVLGLGPGVGRGVLSWERSSMLARGASMLARGASSSSSPASSLAMVTADYSSVQNISNLFTIMSTRCCGVCDRTMGSGGDTGHWTLHSGSLLVFSVCDGRQNTDTGAGHISPVCPPLPNCHRCHSLGHVGHLYTVQTLSTVRCTLYTVQHRHNSNCTNNYLDISWKWP